MHGGGGVRQVVSGSNNSHKFICLPHGQADRRNHACMHAYIYMSCMVVVLPKYKVHFSFIQRYKYAIIIKYFTLGSVKYFIIRYTNNTCICNSWLYHMDIKGVLDLYYLVQLYVFPKGAARENTYNCTR